MNPAPSSTLPPSPAAGREPLLWVFGLIGLLWLQLFLTLMPTWRDGEYYEYGWFVPPLAIGLAWNRWHHARRLAGEPAGISAKRGNLLFFAGLLAVTFISLTRFVSITDPSWRPPILFHASLVVLLSHSLVAYQWGMRMSMQFLPVTVFTLTSVPYPYQIEQFLIRHLTSAVSIFACEAFLLSGKPVELLGERLIMGQEVVEVNEGCSGIRSLQSLVMVALFFGELLLLSLPRRIVLLLVAAACALIINTARAYTLAEIQFTRGKVAFDQAHDMVGHIAFAASAAILFIAARLMLSSPSGGRRIKRTHVASPKPSPP